MTIDTVDLILDIEYERIWIHFKNSNLIGR